MRQKRKIVTKNSSSVQRRTLLCLVGGLNISGLCIDSLYMGGLNRREAIVDTQTTKNRSE